VVHAVAGRTTVDPTLSFSALVFFAARRRKLRWMEKGSV